MFEWRLPWGPRGTTWWWWLLRTSTPRCHGSMGVSVARRPTKDWLVMATRMENSCEFKYLKQFHLFNDVTMYSIISPSHPKLTVDIAYTMYYTRHQLQILQYCYLYLSISSANELLCIDILYIRRTVLFWKDLAYGKMCMNWLTYWWSLIIVVLVHALLCSCYYNHISLSEFVFERTRKHMPCLSVTKGRQGTIWLKRKINSIF